MLHVIRYFILEVAKVTFRPAFHFVLDKFKFLCYFKHVRSCDVGAPILSNDGVDLPVLAPEVLKSKGECFLSMEHVIRKNNNGPMIRTCETAMFLKDVGTHGLPIFHGNGSIESFIN